MELEKLPSIITNTKFNEKGLAVTDSGLLVPAYVASQLGFSVMGRQWLNDVFYSKLRNYCNVLPICPFTASSEYLGSEDFNHIVGKVNCGILMPKSKLMIAILDGGHAVDEGVAAEIGHYATVGYGPVIGIRSDFRLAENPTTGVNLAVRYFLDLGPYNGRFFSGDFAYDSAFLAIKDITDKIIRG